MSFAAAAIVGGSVVGGLLSSNSQKSAARSAANSQTAAAEAGNATQLQISRESIAAQNAAQERAIAEQQRQFDTVQRLLAPYVQSGNSALSAQQALIGLAGPQAQQAAIQQIEQGQEFAALTSAGEDAILANASATGGLRGGNTQAALAQFRPEVLSSLINQQYSRLGGLVGNGQASAVGQANAATGLGQGVSGVLTNTAANIGNIQGNLGNSLAAGFGQIGAAQAGGALARGTANANLFGGITGAINTAVAGGLGPFGASPASAAPLVSPRPVARAF